MRDVAKSETVRDITGIVPAFYPEVNRPAWINDWLLVRIDPFAVLFKF